jgi:hypothetical protein
MARQQAGWTVLAIVVALAGLGWVARGCAKAPGISPSSVAVRDDGAEMF